MTKSSHPNEFQFSMPQPPFVAAGVSIAVGCKNTVSLPVKCERGNWTSDLAQKSHAGAWLFSEQFADFILSPDTRGNDER